MIFSATGVCSTRSSACHTSPELLRPSQVIIRKRPANSSPGAKPSDGLVPPGTPPPAGVLATGDGVSSATDKSFCSETFRSTGV
jgi:hypothetical protein